MVIHAVLVTLSRHSGTHVTCALHGELPTVMACPLASSTQAFKLPALACALTVNALVIVPGHDGTCCVHNVIVLHSPTANVNGAGD